MPSSCSIKLSGVVLAALLGAESVSAQWVSQTLNLRPGWNAVFLEVQPEPADCDTAFANLPIDSAWTWNKRFSPVQYIADPNTLLPGQPDWLVYLQPANPKRPVANLFTLQGGRPYLIRTTSSATLNLRGRPVLRGMEWNADSFNLAGFYLLPGSPLSFQALFAASPAHAGQPMYRLSAAGTWQQITSPSTTSVNSGESYWIRCAGPSTYSGLMKIIFEQGRGLDYGRFLTEQTLHIVNTSSNTATFNLRRLTSASPPNNGYPALAGEVPLSYWRMNLASSQVGWVAMPQQLTSPPIAAGGQWVLRLAVRRADMNQFSLPAGYTSAQYESLLEVTDGAGSRQVVPVTSDSLVSYGLPRSLSKGGPHPLDTGSTQDPRAGLWVGSVVVNAVNQAAVSDVPVPAGSEFQFRVLLHVDNLGEARLLQQVVLAWTNGLYTTNQQGFREPVTPGRYALLTDANLLSRYSGSAIRDGIVTGRRISSAAFGFRDPILFNRTGHFGDSNSTFSCTVAMSYDDDLNPFKHKYHPDHNNLDDHYTTPARECPDVTRVLSLQFTSNDPDNASLPGWGDDQLGGLYSEVITGVHKAQLHLQGTFRIHRASTVPVLNDIPF